MIEEKSVLAPIRNIAIAIIVLLFTVFMLQNTEVVEMTFLLWRFPLSRIVLLFLSLAVGFLVGLVAGWEWFGRKRKP